MSGTDDLEQKLTCSICLQLFREPRLLSCGHTYCQHCLTGYIVSRHPASNSRGQQGLLCPVCREFILAPDRLTPVHRWATMFKPNFLIRDIVEVHARRRQGAEQGGMCPRHPGKELELYCRDCRASVCDRCVALHHRKCEDVVELAEQAQETQQITQQQQQCVTQLLRQLEAKKRRCAAGKKELERIERDIDAKIEYEGQEILRKVADFLCTRKEALKRQAHGHCRKCVNVVNAYTEKCDELSGTLRSLDKMLCNKLRPERLHPSFVNAQEESQVQGMLQKLETAVHKLDSPCHFTVRLIMDDSVITTILANLKLGEISTEEAGDPIRPASDATQRYNGNTGSFANTASAMRIASVASQLAFSPSLYPASASSSVSQTAASY